MMGSKFWSIDCQESMEGKRSLKGGAGRLRKWKNTFKEGRRKGNKERDGN